MSTRLGWRLSQSVDNMTLSKEEAAFWYGTRASSDGLVPPATPAPLVSIPAGTPAATPTPARFSDLFAPEAAKAPATFSDLFKEGQQNLIVPSPDQEPKDPGLLRKIGDLGASFGAGANAMAGSIIDLYGLISGDMDNAPSQYFKKGQEYWSELKSDHLKGLEKARAESIAKEDDQLGKAYAFVKATAKNPSLWLNLLAEQVPMLVPGGAAARGVGVVGKAGKIAKAAQAFDLAGDVAGKTAQLAKLERLRKVATGVAVGVGGVQQGADVGSDAFYRTLDAAEQADLSQNEDYQKLRKKGVPEDEAIATIALKAARIAAIQGTTISLASQALPGARAIEKAMAGVPGKAGLIGRLFTAGAGEALQEAVEEGGGAAAGNRAVQTVDPTQGTWENVGESSVAGAMGAFGLGAAAGAKAGPENLPPPEEIRQNAAAPQDGDAITARNEAITQAFSAPRNRAEYDAAIADFVAGMDEQDRIENFANPAKPTPEEIAGMLGGDTEAFKTNYRNSAVLDARDRVDRRVEEIINARATDPLYNSASAEVLDEFRKKTIEKVQEEVLAQDDIKALKIKMADLRSVGSSDPLISDDPIVQERQRLSKVEAAKTALAAMVEADRAELVAEGLPVTADVMTRLTKAATEEILSDKAYAGLKKSDLATAAATPRELAKQKAREDAAKAAAAAKPAATEAAKPASTAEPTAVVEPAVKPVEEVVKPTVVEPVVEPVATKPSEPVIAKPAEPTKVETPVAKPAPVIKEVDGVQYQKRTPAKKEGKPQGADYWQKMDGGKPVGPPVRSRAILDKINEVTPVQSAEPVVQPATEPVTKPTVKPAAKPVEQPAVKAVEQPAAEPVKPDVKKTAESIAPPIQDEKETKEDFASRISTWEDGLLKKHLGPSGKVKKFAGAGEGVFSGAYTPIIVEAIKAGRVQPTNAAINEYLTRIKARVENDPKAKISADTIFKLAKTIQDSGLSEMANKDESKSAQTSKRVTTGEGRVKIRIGSKVGENRKAISYANGMVTIEEKLPDGTKRLLRTPGYEGVDAKGKAYLEVSPEIDPANAPTVDNNDVEGGGVTSERKDELLGNAGRTGVLGSVQHIDVRNSLGAALQRAGYGGISGLRRSFDGMLVVLRDVAKVIEGKGVKVTDAAMENVARKLVRGDYRDVTRISGRQKSIDRRISQRAVYGEVEEAVVDLIRSAQDPEGTRLLDNYLSQSEDVYPAESYKFNRESDQDFANGVELLKAEIEQDSSDGRQDAAKAKLDTLVKMIDFQIGSYGVGPVRFGPRPSAESVRFTFNEAAFDRLRKEFIAIKGGQLQTIAKTEALLDLAIRLFREGQATSPAVEAYLATPEAKAKIELSDAANEQYMAWMKSKGLSDISAPPIAGLGNKVKELNRESMVVKIVAALDAAQRASAGSEVSRHIAISKRSPAFVVSLYLADRIYAKKQQLMKKGIDQDAITVLLDEYVSSKEFGSVIERAKEIGKQIQKSEQQREQDARARDVLIDSAEQIRDVTTALKIASEDRPVNFNGVAPFTPSEYLDEAMNTRSRSSAADVVSASLHDLYILLSGNREGDGLSNTTRAMYRSKFGITFSKARIKAAVERVGKLIAPAGKEGEKITVSSALQDESITQEEIDDIILLTSGSVMMKASSGGKSISTLTLYSILNAGKKAASGGGSLMTDKKASDATVIKGLIDTIRVALGNTSFDELVYTPNKTALASRLKSMLRDPLGVDGERGALFLTGKIVSKSAYMSVPAELFLDRAERAALNEERAKFKKTPAYKAWLKEEKQSADRWTSNAQIAYDVVAVGLRRGMGWPAIVRSVREAVESGVYPGYENATREELDKVVENISMRIAKAAIAASKDALGYSAVSAGELKVDKSVSDMQEGDARTSTLEKKAEESAIDERDELFKKTVEAEQQTISVRGSDPYSDFENERYVRGRNPLRDISDWSFLEKPLNKEASGALASALNEMGDKGAADAVAEILDDAMQISKDTARRIGANLGELIKIGAIQGVSEADYEALRRRVEAEPLRSKPRNDVQEVDVSTTLGRDRAEATARMNRYQKPPRGVGVLAVDESTDHSVRAAKALLESRSIEDRLKKTNPEEYARKRMAELLSRLEAVRRDTMDIVLGRERIASELEPQYNKSNSLESLRASLVAHKSLLRIVSRQDTASAMKQKDIIKGQIAWLTGRIESSEKAISQNIDKMAEYHRRIQTWNVGGQDVTEAARRFEAGLGSPDDTKRFSTASITGGQSVQRGDLNRWGRAKAEELGGTWVYQNTPSGEVGTLRVGSKSIRIRLENAGMTDLGERAAGSVARGTASDYLITIDPETGRFTTPDHELGHIAVDSLTAPQKAMLKSVGIDLSSREGEEAFVRDHLENEDTRLALAERIMQQNPAKRGVIVRALNSVIRFINGLTNRSYAQLQITDAETLAEGLKNFSILKQSVSDGQISKGFAPSRAITKPPQNDGNFATFQRDFFKKGKWVGYGEDFITAYKGQNPVGKITNTPDFFKKWYAEQGPKMQVETAIREMERDHPVRRSTGSETAIGNRLRAFGRSTFQAMTMLNNISPTLFKSVRRMMGQAQNETDLTEEEVTNILRGGEYDKQISNFDPKGKITTNLGGLLSSPMTMSRGTYFALLRGAMNSSFNAALTHGFHTGRGGAVVLHKNSSSTGIRWNYEGDALKERLRRFAKSEIDSNVAMGRLNRLMNAVTDEHLFPRIAKVHESLRAGTGEPLPQEKYYQALIRLNDLNTTGKARTQMIQMLQSWRAMKSRETEQERTDPVVLNDAFESFGNTIMQSAKVIGYAVPMRNMRELMGVTWEDDMMGTTSKNQKTRFAEKIDERMGAGYASQLMDAIRQWEGGFDTSPAAGFARSLMRAQDVSRLSGPGTALKQLAALTVPLALYDTRSVLKGLFSYDSNNISDKVIASKYGAALRHRLEAGKFIDEIAHSWRQGWSPYAKVRIGIEKKAYWAMRFMDAMTVKKFIVISEKLVEKESPGLTGDEKLKAISEKALDMVNDIQPSGSLEWRTQMHNDGLTGAILNRYRTSINATYNAIGRAFQDARRDPTPGAYLRPMLGTAAALYATSALFKVSDELLRFVRNHINELVGDDDDKEKIAELLKKDPYLWTRPETKAFVDKLMGNPVEEVPEKDRKSLLAQTAKDMASLGLQQSPAWIATEVAGLTQALSEDPAAGYWKERAAGAMGVLPNQNMARSQAAFARMNKIIDDAKARGVQRLSNDQIHQMERQFRIITEALMTTAGELSGLPVSTVNRWTGNAVPRKISGVGAEAYAGARNML